MGEPRDEQTTERQAEENRRFIANMEAASERMGPFARAREWADAPPEKHARVLAELLDLTDEILRSRGVPARKPPLPRLKLRGSTLPGSPPR